MNRITLVFGFALLVIAITLAASITTRNVPGDGHRIIRSAPGGQHPPAADAVEAGQRSLRNRSGQPPAAFQVTLPEPWLASLPPAQREAWLQRAATVESETLARLDRLTAELDLSAAQRSRMFPALARSSPHYDAAMLVGGNAGPAVASLAASDAVYQELEPAQQAVLADEEVNRQLWWQDTLSRLEDDLLESTGGGAPATATDAPASGDAPPASEDRTAPAARGGDSLFDLLGPGT